MGAANLESVSLGPIAHTYCIGSLEDEQAIQAVCHKVALAILAFILCKALGNNQDNYVLENGRHTAVNSIRLLSASCSQNVYLRTSKTRDLLRLPSQQQDEELVVIAKHLCLY